jgi:predicted RNase H-like HicB family nuclease
MTLQKTIKAAIREGEDGFYIAECLEIAIVTQGKTLDETARNLQEAVELFFEGEDPKEYGFIDNPGLLVTFEIDPEYA